MYKNGLLHGTETKYNSKGSIVKIENWNHGGRHAISLSTVALDDMATWGYIYSIYKNGYVSHFTTKGRENDKKDICTLPR